MRLDVGSLTINDYVREQETKEDWVNKTVALRLGRPLETPKGKKLVVKIDVHGNFYVVFGSGGELPGILQGKFNQIDPLVSTINIYLSQQEENPIKDDRKGDK